MMNKSTSYQLSKSTYVRGLQCPKSLYLYKHHYDWQDEDSGFQESIFSTGKSVGEFARGLFPGGVDLTPEHINDRPVFSHSIKRTSEEISKGTQVLYEAAFVGDEVLAAVDILVRDGKKWKIYEVKSGGKVSDTYTQDASLQYYVLTKAGVPISDVSIVIINKEYVRKGKIDIKKLFTIESVLAQAKDSFNDIGKNIRSLKKIIGEKAIPDIPIGPHCSNPYSCSFSGHCWKNVPDYSVFNISRIGEKGWDLFSKGMVKLDDIPEDYNLNSKQWLEVQCYKSKKSHIEKEEIEKFIDSLKYPLYYFDFETFMPAVPIFENTSPYQTIPFQYSLHRQDKKDGKLSHSEYLGDGKTDPRESLIIQFLSETDSDGDILMYTPYERRILNELSEAFPKYVKQLKNRIDRLKDMSTPFGQKHYYTFKMKGSYSIKAVYPALVPKGESYKNLDIADGGSASQAYEGLHYETDPAIIQKIRKDLLAYCHLDTLAMVRVMEVLKNV